MEYAIAVFSSRTETMQFNQYLHKIGINSTIISTPKMARASCSLCVKFPYSALSTIKKNHLHGLSNFCRLFSRQ